MPWAPPDSQSDLLLQQIITRAREQALKGFSEQRKRIEREQAAKGVLGGPVLTRSGTAAETAIKDFGAQLVPDILSVLGDVCGGAPPSDALEWVRATVRSHIDNLVTGLGDQIDGLKTAAGVKGAAKRLEPTGSAAKREVDIEIGRAALRSRAVTTPAVAVIPSPWPSAGADSMYNLLISGKPVAWNGTPFVMARERFLDLQYTDAEVRRRFHDLSSAALAQLVRLPCLLGYEVGVDKDPLFATIRRIVPRDRDIRIEYHTFAVSPFLSHEQFRRLGPELGIQGSEFGTSHWAIKEVNLQRALASVGITLPSPSLWRPPANVANHHFDVGLSFPGEVRSFVRSVADLLEGLLGSDCYFYDDNYKAQLAQPNLDLLLQEIYRHRSRLVVVFLSEAYEKKPWCAGVEFRAIRDIIKEREGQRIMFVRMDDGAVKGTFSLDGAIDARRHSADEVAHMIKERVNLLP